MKNKKIVTTILLATTIFGSSFSFASEIESNVNKTDVTNNPTRVIESFINGIPTVDPNPHLDKGIVSLDVKRSSNPRVTGSDVGLYKSGASYYSKGYVTMKKGSSNFYHYTRAEMDVHAWMSIVSDNIYGYGKVKAETNPHNQSGTARIYYGF